MHYHRIIYTTTTYFHKRNEIQNKILSLFSCCIILPCHSSNCWGHCWHCVCFAPLSTPILLETVTAAKIFNANYLTISKCPFKVALSIALGFTIGLINSFYRKLVWSSSLAAWCESMNVLCKLIILSIFHFFNYFILFFDFIHYFLQFKRIIFRLIILFFNSIFLARL